MTADSPASGLPQEAVDAAARALSVSQQWVTVTGTHPAEAPARVALTAALPFLRQQWEAELPDPNGLAHLRTANALFEERARVAGLQQAVDKVRALHARSDVDGGCVMFCVDAPSDSQITRWPCPTVALLPDVQADDRGTCGHEFHAAPNGLNTYDSRCCEQCGHGVT